VKLVLVPVDGKKTWHDGNPLRLEALLFG
jgi:hypothetical protein